MASPSRRAVGPFTAGILFALLTAACFAGLEGCASAVLALEDALDGLDQPALRRYDAELGWVSLPSLDVAGAWGRGRNLRTNKLGFRGAREVSGPPLAGRIRVFCSGDSFTFGQGVDDQSTWCEGLAQLDPRLETFNLGEPGYGIDQAFLRYRRDVEGIAHEVHIFAFIGADLDRAVLGEHHGYAKPRLGLEADALRVDNVPVPYVLPALRRFVRSATQDLRVVELMRRGLAKLGVRPSLQEAPEIERHGPLLERIFCAVAELGEARGSATLFVYLPVQSELERDGRWRGWVREAFGRLRYPFIDLTDALRAVPPPEVVGYFIAEGADAEGHYTESGNAWAARAIRAGLHASVPLDLGTPVSNLHERSPSAPIPAR
jgi:hypothetical protein